MTNQTQGGFATMKKEDILEAMRDIKFAESIMDIQSPEEIQKAFKTKGIDLSLEESQVVISTIKKVDESEYCELSEEDLKKITGGTSEATAQGQAGESAPQTGNEKKEKKIDPRFENVAIVAAGVAVGMFAYATLSTTKNLFLSAGGKIADAIIRKIKK